MLANIGALLGGLGLFLLAVRLITQGLREAAGSSLRELLSRSTQSPARGIASGLALTALVQSSSAVTVATIGFVNAGLLSLYQALGVVYGANIGTTMTGWLVAAVGFNFKIDALALPLIGTGMVMRLSGGQRRIGSFGEALAGFGLFFIGVDVLRGAFEQLATAVDIGSFASAGSLGALLYVGAGFLMTVLTQSSSAAIALVLTAASGGVVELGGAAAMVIGANVGTTSTAALATIGATPNAKRVAAAHIVFNLATGVVALVLLRPMLWAIHAGSESAGLTQIPVVTLALFHTMFNVIGVILMWPITGPLIRFLAARFQSAEEIESKPRFLDKTIALTPALALDALRLEAQRISHIALRMARQALGGVRSTGMRSDLQAVRHLAAAVGDFVISVQQRAMAEATAKSMPRVLRAVQYFVTAAELSLAIDNARAAMHRLEGTLGMQFEELEQRVRLVVDRASREEAERTGGDWDAEIVGLHTDYQDLKAQVLDEAAHGRLSPQHMADVLEQISRMRRLTEQVVKGARYLGAIGELDAKTSEVAPSQNVGGGTDTAPSSGQAPPS